MMMFLFRFNEKRNNMDTIEETLTEAADSLTSGIYRLAAAITPNIPGSNDDSGTHVASLTEAVMGMTSGLIAIASAIEELANAVRGHSDE
jgi:hypothetical protein